MVDCWTLTMSLDDAPERAAETEARLVEASRGGDSRAFGDLVRRHERRVFRLAGRFFRRREDVEDVAQETFLAAWRRLETYRARAPFEHWLTRICLHCCYARLGRERPAAALDREPIAPAVAPEAAIDLERILAHLPARDRFVLLLLEGEGWSVAEIAARLGWSRVNVKVRAHRARRRLRAILERESPR
jgi:RNA polymerase sigma-70 factor (ECF subfamily)